MPSPCDTQGAPLPRWVKLTQDWPSGLFTLAATHLGGKLDPRQAHFVRRWDGGCSLGTRHPLNQSPASYFDGSRASETIYFIVCVSFTMGESLPMLVYAASNPPKPLIAGSHLVKPHCTSLGQPKVFRALRLSSLVQGAVLGEQRE